MHQIENIKIKLITIINKDEYSWLIQLYANFLAAKIYREIVVVLEHDGWMDILFIDAQP